MSNVCILSLRCDAAVRAGIASAKFYGVESINRAVADLLAKPFWRR